MKLATPYRVLGYADPSAFDELRDPTHPFWPAPEADVRSNLFETHKATTSILFRWTPRDHWPKLVIEEREPWRHMAPEVTDLWKRVAELAGLPERPPINMMLARLSAGGEISRHKDLHPFFGWARRIHVPLYVPEGCVFECAGVQVPTVRGQVFELSNRDPHSVVNASDEARFHFVLDFAP